MRLSGVLASVLAGLIVTGCATKPNPPTGLGVDRSITTAAYQADEPLVIRSENPVKDTIEQAKIKLDRPSASTSLTGRSITVSSIGDIQLRSKEVVLTFDDGPAPGKTERILNTLDEYGVKATFLMVGTMAKAHPRLARTVVTRGHSVGSHTYTHANLQNRSFDAAVADIRKGESAMRSAGLSNIKFFRFPYLADTGALRTHLASRGTVVLDVDVDSKDYYKVSPARVVQQTMNRLEKRGKGIILMHDLHARTASMLPTLLKRLKSEGYKVVHLQPGSGGSSDVVAQLN